MAGVIITINLLSDDRPSKWGSSLRLTFKVEVFLKRPSFVHFVKRVKRTKFHLLKSILSFEEEDKNNNTVTVDMLVWSRDEM